MRRAPRRGLSPRARRMGRDGRAKPTASSAATSRPVSRMSKARPRPTICGHRTVPPRGSRSATSGWPTTLVFSDPKRRSTPQSNSHPPPRALPSSSPTVTSRPVRNRANVAAADVRFGGFGVRRDELVEHVHVAVHDEELRVALFNRVPARSVSSRGLRARRSGGTTRRPADGSWRRRRRPRPRSGSPSQLRSRSRAG